MYNLSVYKLNQIIPKILVAVHSDCGHISLISITPGSLHAPHPVPTAHLFNTTGGKKAFYPPVDTTFSILKADTLTFLGMAWLL